MGLDGGSPTRASSPAPLDADTAAVFVQNPNFLGAVEDLEALAARRARRRARSCVASVDPITLGVLRPPGECGVDMALGEGQPMGGRLDFGGPSFGFFAATDEHLRRMPGRIAGETTDADGRRGFVLALQTREQHIRREKATHNICTSQALNALGGVDLPGVARQARDRRDRRAAGAAHRVRARAPGRGRGGRAASRRAGRPRVRACGSMRRCSEVLDRVAEDGIAAGYPLARDYPEYEDGLLIAITERRSKGDIDRLADVARASRSGDR